MCTTGCRCEHGITDAEAGILSGFGPEAMKPAPKLQRASKLLKQGGQRMCRRVSAPFTACYMGAQVSSVSSVHRVRLDVSDGCLMSMTQEDMHFLWPARDPAIEQLLTPVQAAPEAYANVYPTRAAQMGMTACPGAFGIMPVYISSPGFV